MNPPIVISVHVPGPDIRIMGHYDQFNIISVTTITTLHILKKHRHPQHLPSVKNIKPSNKKPTTNKNPIYHNQYLKNL